MLWVCDKARWSFSYRSSAPPAVPCTRLRLPGARLWTVTASIWATATDPSSYTVALATTLGKAGARDGDWSELIDACLFAEIMKRLPG